MPRHSNGSNRELRKAYFHRIQIQGDIDAPSPSKLPEAFAEISPREPEIIPVNPVHRGGSGRGGRQFDPPPRREIRTPPSPRARTPPRDHRGSGRVSFNDSAKVHRKPSTRKRSRSADEGRRHTAASSERRPSSRRNSLDDYDRRRKRDETPPRRRTPAKSPAKVHTPPRHRNPPPRPTSRRRPSPVRRSHSSNQLSPPVRKKQVAPLRRSTSDPQLQMKRGKKTKNPQKPKWNPVGDAAEKSYINRYQQNYASDYYF
ncbi:unnamed protein product, partial [Mesorhabditis belari]|uniref:Uncharacterized protein n=1 Tax=Mesorhabditis belari TaxID=2138241 RepID=A0AAF3ES68_9BILA